MEEAIKSAKGRHAFISLPFLDAALSFKLFQRGEFKRARSQKLRALQFNAAETVSRMVKPFNERTCDRCGSLIKRDTIPNGSEVDYAGHLYYCLAAGRVQGLIRSCTEAIRADHGITVAVFDAFQQSAPPKVKNRTVHVDVIKGLFSRDFKSTVAKIMKEQSDEEPLLDCDRLVADITADISEIASVAFAHITEPYRYWKSQHRDMEFSTASQKAQELRKVISELNMKNAPGNVPASPWPRGSGNRALDDVDSSDEESNETSSSGRDLDFDSGDEALFEVDAMEATPPGEEVRDDEENPVDDDSDSDDNNHETCIQQ